MANENKGLFEKAIAKYNVKGIQLILNEKGNNVTSFIYKGHEFSCGWYDAEMVDVTISMLPCATDEELKREANWVSPQFTPYYTKLKAEIMSLTEMLDLMADRQDKGMDKVYFRNAYPKQFDKNEVFELEYGFISRFEMRETIKTWFNKNKEIPCYIDDKHIFGKLSADYDADELIKKFLDYRLSGV